MRAALRAAAETVAAVLGGRTLDEALTADPALRGAQRELASAALRAYGRGDAALAQLMPAPPRPALLRALLLVALARLAARPAEAHTVVNEAVAAARQLAGGRAHGLVNGVLRNYLRRAADIEAALNADPVCRHGLPGWWLEALQADHPQHWTAICAAANEHPPMCLRVNRRRCTVDEYAGLLAAQGMAARQVGVEALLLERPLGVDRLPNFAAGWVSVQDAGAQHAAHLLDLAPGQRVLDACAAPGGKSAHILELADVDLLALDASPERAARMAPNFARLGVQARIAVADCRKTEAWWDGRPYDRILADVPCTASGVVRRHPDAKWLRRRSDTTRFAQTQHAILASLWNLLAPGGKLLYATCSVFAEENVKQIQSFTSAHPDCRILPINDQPSLQLLPAPAHDGFFYALLSRLS
ncbi:MAG: 16S rRNA (cytosine(967)-C(5))-methyltransferase RsmB [Rhodocyclaceae bacterium]|nr:16S rRNA (cytosine(967)-C(5))-methyltransferase RsmB [Rhodocyclaceae bacterium]MBX3669596.1 16S rRNA (cytosine(967)-C(5))-methyltransferase RsmB [Rhodocyclaceae bacterium]